MTRLGRIVGSRLDVVGAGHRLRAMHVEDEPFCTKLFHEARSAMLVGLEPALVGTLVRQQFDGQTAAYAARYPKARYLIVETGGMPIGRMVIDQTTDAITLVDIALLAAWRGRGVGGAVLREILDTAADQGLPVRLRVAVDSPARRLYARLGFAVVAATEMHREMVWTPTYYGRADH